MAAANGGAVSSKVRNFKVVLLGEGKVGKTSLVLRYVEDKFNDAHVQTLKATHLTKKLNIGGHRVNVSVWDTAGQERFHAMGPIYYRGSNGAVLVYDITDDSTFQKVKNWVKELRKMLGSDICLIIAGNKVDLEKDRNVPIDIADEYAKSVGAVHLPTSAKQNLGIEEMFLDLAERMLKRAEELESSSEAHGLSRNNSMRSRNTVIIDDDDEPAGPPQSRFCCSGS